MKISLMQQFFSTSIALVSYPLLLLIHKQTGIACMKGAKWRLLAAKYKQIILPSITSAKRREVVGEIFSLVAEIQWICYAGPLVRLHKGVRLRLHGSSYLLALLLSNAYPDLSGE